MKKIGLLLAGSGVFDGSEIREAVLSILSLEKAKADIIFLAPNISQYHVVNHQNGELQTETRNLLEEAARIARGPVTALDSIDSNSLDGLIIPGGFGVAKNLSDFAVTEAEFTVQSDTASLLKEMITAKKPVGLACIAPVLAVPLFPGVKLTVGMDQTVSNRLESLGAYTQNSRADEIVVCPQYTIVSTAAYMLDAPLYDIQKGIDKMVEKVLELSHSVSTSFSY